MRKRLRKGSHLVCYFEKECLKCHSIKPLSDYCKSPNTYDKRAIYCKECIRAAAGSYPSQTKEMKALRGQKRAKRKNSNYKTPEERAILLALERQGEGTKVCLSCKQEKDLKLFALDRNRRKANCNRCNADSCQAYMATRTRRLKGLHDGSVTGEAITRLKTERLLCPYCGEGLNDINRELDHMDPVSRGGRHSTRNLIACCGACNRKKGANTFGVWVSKLSEPYSSIAASEYNKKSVSI